MVLGAPDRVNIPCLMHDTRLCQLDVKMTNVYIYNVYVRMCVYILVWKTITTSYISVRTNPYPLSNRIIDKRAKVGKNSITCGPFKHQRAM